MPEAAARNFDKLVAARGGSNQSHPGFFGGVPEDGIHSPPASKLFTWHDRSDLSEYRPGCIPTKVRHSISGLRTAWQTEAVNGAIVLTASVVPWVVALMLQL